MAVAPAEIQTYFNNACKSTRRVRAVCKRDTRDQRGLLGDEQFGRSIIFVAGLFMEENAKTIVRGIFRGIASLDKHSVIRCSASNPLLPSATNTVENGEQNDKAIYSCIHT